MIAAAAAVSAAIMRRILPWVGLRIGPNSLGWTAIQMLVGLGLLALVDYSTSMITNGFGGF